MKKILIILALMMAITTCKAGDDVYTAFQFALKVRNSYGNWTEWTDWESCNIRIEVSNDGIIIYSSTPQGYVPTSKSNTYYDNSGGYNIEFNCVDLNRKYCILRLRKETNGNSQLYIQYNDAMWVYNVRAN